MSSGTGTVDLGQSGVPAEPERSGEPTGATRRSRAVDLLRRLGEANALVVTVCAIVAALVFGALLILCTSPPVLQAWGHVGSNPGHAFSESWSTVAAAYSALVEGSIFNPHAQDLTQAFNPISETLVYYKPGHILEAERLLKSLTGIVGMVQGATSLNADVTVVTGSDYTVRVHPAKAKGSAGGTTKSGSTSTTSSTSTSSTTTTSLATTTTTTQPSSLGPPSQAAQPLPGYDPRACHT